MLGAKIREIRRLKDLSQETVAIKVGLTQAQISKIERNIRDISVSEAKALAEALGVSVAELIESA